MLLCWMAGDGALGSKRRAIFADAIDTQLPAQRLRSPGRFDSAWHDSQITATANDAVVVETTTNVSSQKHWTLE